MRFPRQLRTSLPQLPGTMRSLPIDWRGYPVPFFVGWPQGQPDHRTADPKKMMRCVTQGLCWVCGKPLAPPAVCVMGPMAGINRTHSEPPSHEACARFAVQACPFLAHSQAHRREANLPEDKQAPAGTMFLHNPGISLLWWTQQVKAFRAGDNPRSPNLLFHVGEPLKVEWWTEGRPATRRECEDAIEAADARLRPVAEKESAGDMLSMHTFALRAWLPPG